MTAREHAAFAAGIRHAADLALIAAITVELRPDGGAVRQQAAIEALRGLAEALKEQAASNYAVSAQYLQRTDTDRPNAAEATSV